MKQSEAEILREYGPFDGVDSVHGVTFDGKRVWFASGANLNALDSDSGAIVGSIDVAAHAGTAFDGEHLFQIAGPRIFKIDPKTGAVVGAKPPPGDRAPCGGGGAGGAFLGGNLAARHKQP
ncbi:MAG: glutamine cyclotransferase, partial [Caulobacter sp.]